MTQSDAMKAAEQLERAATLLRTRGDEILQEVGEVRRSADDGWHWRSGAAGASAVEHTARRLGITEAELLLIIEVLRHG